MSKQVRWQQHKTYLKPYCVEPSQQLSVKEVLQNKDHSILKSWHECTYYLFMDNLMAIMAAIQIWFYLNN